MDRQLCLFPTSQLRNSDYGMVAATAATAVITICAAVTMQQAKIPPGLGATATAATGLPPCRPDPSLLLGAYRQSSVPLS